MKLAAVVLTHPLFHPKCASMYRALGKEKADLFMLSCGYPQEECCISIDEDSRGVVLAFSQAEWSKPEKDSGQHSVAIAGKPLVIVVPVDKVLGRVAMESDE